MEASASLVVVDNTHSQLWEYTRCIQRATAMGYTVTIAEVDCPNLAVATVRPAVSVIAMCTTLLLT